MKKIIPILSIAEMNQADITAISGGMSAYTLMESAGKAIAREIVRRWQPRQTLVFCGPGNNGGDGYVAARHLHEMGWDVKVISFNTKRNTSIETSEAIERWKGPVECLSDQITINPKTLIIDAIYGTGISRDIDSRIVKIIQCCNTADIPIVSADIPSGISGDTGEIFNAAFKAKLTVTFAAPKKGHFLLPGRDYCGELVVADIGIEEKVITNLSPTTFLNDPTYWINDFPIPNSFDHKYSRGHSLIIGGGALSSGASRLAAEAAFRIGAGAVTLLAEKESVYQYANYFKAIMIDDMASLNKRLKMPQKLSIVIGPGSGVGSQTNSKTLRILKSGFPCVLDADALTSGAEDRQNFISCIHNKTVLTPHEGEFKRLFDFQGDKLTRTSLAAREVGAVVVLKGPDTIISSPDGRNVINNNATPWLATAGSGDVLAGMIAGLQTQGMPSFEAACAGVWIHGEASNYFRLGLISEDIADLIPKILNKIIKNRFI